MQDVNVSVVFLACNQIKGALPVDNVSDELFFDPREVILAAAIQHIMLDTVREDHFVEVIGYLDNDFVSFVKVGNGSGVPQIIDVKNMDIINSNHLCSYLTVELSIRELG